jgi:hypothetical protein
VSGAEISKTFSTKGIYPDFSIVADSPKAWIDKCTKWRNECYNERVTVRSGSDGVVAATSAGRGRTRTASAPGISDLEVAGRAELAEDVRDGAMR